MQSMSERLSGKPYEKNPLQTIGITSKVLGLGLTDDEIYKYCHRVARELFTMFHDDTGRTFTPKERESQLRFSEAFTHLKDRTIFDCALQELRVLKSEDRHEVNQLNRDLEDIKAERERLNKKIAFCLHHHAHLEEAKKEVQDRFIEYMTATGLTVAAHTHQAQPGAIIFTHASRIVLMGLAAKPDPYGRHYNSVDQALLKYKKRYEQLVQTKQIENKGAEFAHEVIKSGLTAMGLGWLLRKPYSKTVLPAVRWNHNIAFHDHDMPELVEGRVSPKCEAQEMPSGVILSKTELARRYREAMKVACDYLGSTAHYFEYLCMQLAAPPVMGGKIEVGGDTYGVCGSIPVKEAKLPFYDNWKIMLNDDDAAATIEPVLTRFALLVGTKIDRTVKVATDPVEARGKLMDVCKRFVGKNSRFRILGVILDVEC